MPYPKICKNLVFFVAKYLQNRLGYCIIDYKLGDKVDLSDILYSAVYRQRTARFFRLSREGEHYE